MPGTREVPTLKWDDYPPMRYAVTILHRHFTNWSAQDRLDVFNAIFKAHLSEFPHSELTSRGTLDQQWHTRKRDSKKWAVFLQDPADMTDEEFHAYELLYQTVKAWGKKLGKMERARGNYSDDDGLDEEENNGEVSSMTSMLEAVDLEGGDGEQQNARCLLAPATWRGKAVDSMIFREAAGLDGGDVAQNEEVLDSTKSKKKKKRRRRRKNTKMTMTMIAVDETEADGSSDHQPTPESSYLDTVTMLEGLQLAEGATENATREPGNAQEPVGAVGEMDYAR